MTEYIRFRALRTNPVSFSSRELQSDGTYFMCKPGAGEAPYRCQHDMADLPMFPTITAPAALPNGKQSLGRPRRERKDKRKKKTRSK